MSDLPPPPAPPEADERRIRRLYALALAWGALALLLLWLFARSFRV